ncbi:MAG: hypothetical protein WBQ08_22600 [Candidatus Sulfotelmatobacter sp.]
MPKIGALSHLEEYPLNDGRIVAEGTFGVWRTILKDFDADGLSELKSRALHPVCANPM